MTEEALRVVVLEWLQTIGAPERSTNVTDPETLPIFTSCQIIVV